MQQRRYFDEHENSDSFDRWYRPRLSNVSTAAAQSSSAAGQMSSDQLKKQAAAQKKAGDAKEKWVKAQGSDALK
jgi:hypothetical protein